VSGLLQRLAGQAMGTQANGAPRIRSAMSVHAHMPIGVARDGEAPWSMPGLVPVVPRSQAAGPHTPTATQPASSPEFTTVMQSGEPAREPTPLANPTQPVESPSMSPLASREPPDRHASHDVAEKPPRPLLEEVEAISSPPMIAPAAQPSLAVTVAPNGSRAEPTEVHVHIGRIEVIAAPEAGAPKKNRAAPARNTLPLADYLARRRGS